MASSFFSKLKDSISQSVPSSLPKWRYEPLQKSESASREPWQTSIRDCLVSKTLWRIIFILVAVLLLANIILSPTARVVLDKYGWATTRPGEVDNLQKFVGDKDIDWTQYAYCQYVTNEDYLCNSVMIFESLMRVGAKANRVMLYPQDWKVYGQSDTDSENDAKRQKLLLKASNEYKVDLVPIEVQHLNGDATWADSFTKLLAFNQTHYKRVLSLDSDATVLQPMDELFLLPSAPVAMPRAYWLDNGQLSSQVVLVEPSQFEFQRIVNAMNSKQADDYDMEIVNDLYARDCLILPHRKYDLLTGEFHNENSHRLYLGSEQEIWDPEKVLNETKFLHFSDWPMPKPWKSHREAVRKETMPKCKKLEDGGEDCRDQKCWQWAYEDFLDRRKRVCGEEFMPN